MATIRVAAPVVDRGILTEIHALPCAHPQTERMIADLPGGICSWSDYSTYLSSESERTPEHSPSLGSIENATLDSALSLDYSLPSDVQSPPDLPSLSSPPAEEDPLTGSHVESLVDAEVTPRERPVISSSDLQSPDCPSACIRSPISQLRPQSKLHLGRESREGSVQRCSPNGEVERETAEGEAERRIRRIQDTVEESLASLYVKLSTLEGTMSHLPRDSIDSMLSTLMTILTELRSYDEEITQLQARLREIPADIESQRFSTALTGIRTRVTALLDQAEQGRVALEQAREGREKRGQEIQNYKLFLDETDAWLRNVMSKMHEQHSLNTNKALQKELTSRVQQVSELESLPEVSALATALKEALLDVISRLQQKQQEICDEEAQADDESTEDNATLDEAPSIHSSLGGGPPSLADVSLQTGQSLLIDDVVEKKTQLTKQTSTTQMPSSTTCHSLTTQTTQALLPSESVQTQEAIKVLKTTKGDHDVIEIATKYVPSSSGQELARLEQCSALPSENIVVDMKYQDAQKADSATSELNIVHIAPQSFETVLVEPDDVTTEVVVDADGTKRIIVRKLRRTTVTSRQTTQQRVSTLSTALDGAPPTVQAFSEAAMRDQQVTVTRTRPDGTIETTTRQIYGGRVTTGAPAEGIKVEEYESEPRYTRIVTQGQIGDIGSQPVEEEEVLMEGGEYQTKTSSVHAVVQQVTRRVIKRTRKIIRKVTVVDGKETTTEEVIEEPEEIEIDEEDIPHISINVVKSEDQKIIAPEAIETEREELTKPEMPVDNPGSPMQGPFFGPFAKDTMKEAPTAKKDGARIKTLDVQTEDSTILREPTTELADSRTERADSKLISADSEQTREVLSSSEHDRLVPQAENLTDIRVDEDLPTVQNNENAIPKETEQRAMEEDKHEHFLTEVNGTGTLMADSRALLDAERYAVLQTPVEDVYVTATQAESVKTSLESAVTDDEPVVTKATCKSDDAPVKSEILTVDLENGTVDVEKQHDGSSTVDTAKDIDVSNIVVLKEEDQQETKPEVLEKRALIKPAKSEEEAATSELLEKLQRESIIPLSESNIIKSSEDKADSTYVEISPKQQETLPDLFTKEEDNTKAEAFKPEYKPLFHKVEISLSVREENTETEPLVSIKTQAERPRIAPYSIVKEDVNISLPVDKETIEVIHDKFVQTSAFGTVDKETETSRQRAAEEKEEDLHIESSERSKTDTLSHKSRKKKRRKRKPESLDKSEELESSTSIVTSIAESIAINMSDSSDHGSEQPQPDVAKVVDSESDVESSCSEMPDVTKDEAVKVKEIDAAGKAEEEAIREEESIEKYKSTLDDANTQTVVETCNVSTTFSPTKEGSLFTQTPPEPAVPTLDETIQTEEAATLTEESAMQTSPVEDVLPVITATETENSQVQTVDVHVLSTETQTSPVETARMTATETQTTTNTATEVEQQTTPPPVTETVIVQEAAMQTSSPEPQCLEKDTHAQTIIASETTETQTAPEEQKANLQETGMQTKSPEPITETAMQTTPITDPPVTQFSEESQTSLEETKQTTETESQTASLKNIQTLESSVQLEREELIPQIEESVQNTPEVSEISAQTSPKEEKQSTETTSVYQQTTQIPICDVTVSTKDLEAATTMDNAANKTFSPTLFAAFSKESIELEGTQPTEKEASAETVKPLTATVNQVVPENGGLLKKTRKMKITDDNTSEISIVPKKLMRMETEEETKHQFPEKAAAEGSSLCGNTENSYMEPSLSNSSFNSSCKMDNQSYTKSPANLGDSTAYEIFDEFAHDSSYIEEFDMDLNLLKPKTNQPKNVPSPEEPESKIDIEHSSKDFDAFATNQTSMMESRYELMERVERENELLHCTSSTPLPTSDDCLLSEEIFFNTEDFNLFSNESSDHMATILQIAHLKGAAEDVKEKKENQELDISEKIGQLSDVVKENDVVKIEKALIAIVNIISIWLKYIEYQVLLKKECVTGSFQNSDTEFNKLKEEVTKIERYTQNLDDICKKMELNYSKDKYEKLQVHIGALKNQIKTVKNVTTDGAKHNSEHLTIWNNFQNNVNAICRSIKAQREKLNDITRNEHETERKLTTLEKLENINRKNMLKTVKLFNTARELQYIYPNAIIPKDMYDAHEMTKEIEHDICIEREHVFQLFALAKEYEQTLQEFEQIIKIAQSLLDNPISVTRLKHLQEEMQKHRKFFLNLNHCSTILESLEGNLDIETRDKHSYLHNKLHGEATKLIDRAVLRAQEMALVASRWMLLEQDLKEEEKWLLLQQTLVPNKLTELKQCDSHISTYQSLTSDIANHHARLIKLHKMSCDLHDLIKIEVSENQFDKPLDVIVKLQHDTNSSLRKLLAFKEIWNKYESLIDCSEKSLKIAEQELVKIYTTEGKSESEGKPDVRHFWEVKVHYEVYKNVHNEAISCFEQSQEIIPLSNMEPKQNHHEALKKRWEEVYKQIREIHYKVLKSIDKEGISMEKKIELLEEELDKIRTEIENENLYEVRTMEELDLYIQKTIVLFERIIVAQDDISRLGLISSIADSERIGSMLSSARHLEYTIDGQLQAARLFKSKLQSLQQGLDRFKKINEELTTILDQCEKSQNEESAEVAAAANRCQSVMSKLHVLWQDLETLSVQSSHLLISENATCPITESLETELRSIVGIQLSFKTRSKHLLSLLKERLRLWGRFEEKLQLVQKSVEKADYMREVYTAQGPMNYERLLKATERLKSLSGDLDGKENLINQLRDSARPLQESCTKDVCNKIDVAVIKAVDSWEKAKTELGSLCIRYQNACKLWAQYKDSSAVVTNWLNTQMNKVENLPSEEAKKQIKDCQKKLAEHKETLTELRTLVAQIASDVGFDTQTGPLHSDIKILDKRLEDVQDTLSNLRETVENRLHNQEETRKDLCKSKEIVETTQQKLTTVSEDDCNNEQLTVLRDHLLNLTRTESNLQIIKDQTINESAIEQKASVVEVIQLWQCVFQDTFQQYHQILTRLIHTQDVVAALNLWKEYLKHVRDFLLRGIPSDYKNLSEQRNLCEVYQKLLPEQQKLILAMRENEDWDQSVTEQFNSLTNLHNEMLMKILERQMMVRSRMTAWDKYRTDQRNLLKWIQESEEKKIACRCDSST
ncbi:hypothetical protein X777_05796 [Ooceraea biroi]|uniref:KASH domain-containing protein n=1 Tax=Ooceraea biroi TaxID=2015173 RepID=A0A026WDB1_OOCBI|nr:hypothetical protein X777_05796 [Ooceraea biroi]